MNDNQAITSRPENESQALLRMRWFILIILAIGFLGSIIASIITIIILKNYLPLAVPSSIVLAMRPVIHWLFPKNQSN